jgi:hypothetical protein
MDTAFDKHKDEILKKIIYNNVIVLTSDTGLGKTTRVPLYMIELFTKKGLEHKYDISSQGSGAKVKSNINNYSFQFIDATSNIICTQPKNALVLEHSDPGSHLSKAISEPDPDPDSKDGFIISKKTTKDGGEWGKALTLVTSGWLCKYMTNDPYLIKQNVSCVIVDEAHERSVENDILLCYLKKIMLVRPNFKIVIMSATIDHTLFTNYFYGAEYIHIGRTIKPKEVFEIWSEKPVVNYIYEIYNIIKNKIQKSNKDILIFVPGSKAIKDIPKLFYSADVNLYKKFFWIKSTADGIKTINDIAFGEDNQEEKDFKTAGDLDKDTDFKSRPKIIISTNVWESSVTLTNLGFVIDSGLMYESNYDPKTNIRFLSQKAVTRDSSTQRKGRVGRVANGTCYYLYTKDFFDSMEAHKKPDILCKNIEYLFIDFLSRGFNFLNIDYLQPPSMSSTRFTIKNLEIYGVIKEGFDIYSNIIENDNCDNKKIKLFNKLNYLKSGEGLSLDPFLIFILSDNMANLSDDLIKFVISIAIYLDQKKKKNEFSKETIRDLNDVDHYYDSSWTTDFKIIDEANIQTDTYFIEIKKIIKEFQDEEEVDVEGLVTDQYVEGFEVSGGVSGGVNHLGGGAVEEISSMISKSLEKLGNKCFLNKVEFSGKGNFKNKTQNYIPSSRSPEPLSVSFNLSGLAPAPADNPASTSAPAPVNPDAGNIECTYVSAFFNIHNTLECQILTKLNRI